VINRKTRTVSLAVAMLFATTALAACSSSPSTGAAATTSKVKIQTINMAVSPYVGLAPLYLGIKEGFFKKQGIQLKLTSIAAPPAVLQAVIGGHQDVGFAVTPSVLTAVASGADAKCIAPLAGNVSTVKSQRSTGIAVLKGSPITKPQQLAGKKVAVSAIGGQQALQVQALVDKYGGDWKSVQLVPLAFGNMNAALKSGDVDAIASTTPFIQQAVADGGRVLDWMESELAPNASLVCSVSNDAFIKAHPDLVTKYQKAMAQSLDYAKAHVSQARAQLPGILGITAAVAKTMPLGVVFDSKLNMKSIKDTQTMMVKYGYLKAVLPNSSFLDYPGAN
jgi:NitT/TauT family transport system substrate-binding protein